MKITLANHLNNYKTNLNKQNQIHTTNKKQDKSTVSFGAIPVTPEILGGAVVFGLAVVGAIKYRKNIVKFAKNLMQKTSSAKNSATEATSDVKKPTKKVYDKIKNDYIMFMQENLHKDYTTNPNMYHPNGTMFTGPNCKAKDKAIEDLVKLLERHDWDIVRMPLFDVTKLEKTMIEGHYASNYYQNFLEVAETAAKKYKETGKRTAIVMRALDTFTARRNFNLQGRYPLKMEMTSMLLDPVENLRKNGTTLITDCVNVGEIDKALGRSGRICAKVIIRPLPEDSQEAWNLYLKKANGAYHEALEFHETYKTCPTGGFANWRLQNALDVFPEQYKASSKLYQELKGQKFYPFEIQQ